MPDTTRDDSTREEECAKRESGLKPEPLLKQIEADLELDVTLELDLRDNEDYTPDEPVSKSGMQYSPKRDDQINRMGTAPLGKLILEFAVPAILSMVVNGSYNIISSIFLGLRLGELGLATAQATTPLMIMAMAVAVLIGAGGNALAAVKLGEGKREVAERVIGNTFVLSIALGFLCTIAAILLMDPILWLSGSTEQVHEMAKSFVLIIAIGFVPQFLGSGFNNYLRTAGNPSGALYTMLAGALVSTGLSFLFVMVFDWGVVGSAWATVGGMLVTCLTVLYYFTLSKDFPFKLKRSLLVPKLRLMANICVLGSASFFLQIAAVVINLVLNNQLVTYGALDPIGSEGSLAAMGVVMRIAQFSFFTLLGVTVATQPILGYNYGAEIYGRVKSTIKISMIWVMASGVFFWLLVHIFPVQIVELFGVKAELHDFTIKAIQVMMILAPLVGLQVLTSGYFQSTGQPIKSMFVSLTRQLLYLVPLLLFLPILVQQFALGITPLESIYYTYPVADVLSIITAGGMLLREWRRLTRKQKAREQHLAQAAA